MKSLKYIIIFIGALSLQSCFVAQEYSRAPDVVKEEYFRTDKISTDSLSMANLSWKEVFTDPLLTGYIETALANNLDIRIALKNIDVAEAYLRQGKAAYFPNVSGNLSYSGSSPSLNSQSGMGLNKRDYFNQFEASGSVSWEPDIWGKIRSSKRAAGATYLQSVAAHQAVKSNLVAAVASTYYQLLALDEQKKIALETIENREQSLETMKALKIAGVVNEVAVQQTNAQLLNAKTLLLDTENQIKLLENTFCILLNEEPHEIERTALDSQNINTNVAYGVPIQLLSNRPDVLAAEYGLINAFELTNVAKSSFYPSLRLTASAGLQSLEFDNLFSSNSLFANILGSLTQPIFNGRQIKTQHEVRLAQQEAALLNYKSAVLNASAEVSDALYSFETNNKKIGLKQEEYEAYDRAVTDSEELLNYGLANYLEVITARDQRLNAQLNLINTKFARLNSFVQLYRALGGGWR